ncbi:MAG: glycosyltransferase family 4 protein [Acidobacteriaceae bacterium]|nr:glycosyltransferase family 4 protein [Acidobacteriaceae bacterium]
MSAPTEAIPILLFVRELGIGGIERDVAKLALGLDRKRFLPHVATYKPGGPRHDELHGAGIPILHVEFPSLISAAALRAAMTLASFIRRNRITIVHAFDPSSIFAVPVARLLRVPVVLSSQLGHRDLYDLKTRKELNVVDRLSDVVVVNCEALRGHLIDDCSLPAERIELCYNGVDTREFYPGPTLRPPELAGASLVIGAVSVLRPEKGLELLQAAFAKVRQFVPGSKLLLVGSGPELSNLEANSDRLGIRDACIFTPAVRAPAPLMRAIDVFVSSSYSEAFSNAILEAMACGCCLIGSRVGGTPELLGEDERGLLFKPGDVDDLAAKLIRVMRDSEMRARLQASAARHACQFLNIERNVQRNMQIYDMLLERKRVAHRR